ncbi:His Kinase A (phospho-acceptor) domain-containing protein [Paenibacillus sp. UNCCL117]|uniref:MEDS domain-containing protein n=1 Tax=unclassified Paenibacillus TaxID=185978 RepID=UPI00088C2565|nr:MULTISPECIES: MEDS domain-containing protein [unclassified Paenibacillus]SDD77313.1 His Kinase A (phospho-acceptor) domain-containing protein [Paenibacillus sp. cl123]SFW52690.1 His Kinase A (phospho-acceptor) domain-containing protein [Paenibacillus sp. UNCCL117]
MAPQNSIPLTNKIQVQSGSHIVYFFSDYDKYIDNAVSFIRSGMELAQHVIIIDTREMYEAMERKLLAESDAEQWRERLHYMNQADFYETYRDFHFQRILSNLDGIVQPFVASMTDVRVWGQVGWKPQDHIPDKILQYEAECDAVLSKHGFLTVCAYDANIVAAAVQLKALQSHPYLMTDEALVLSGLYQRKEGDAAVLPILSAQQELESQMDLYKQKLDFAHVVSHEVRNPLTVIKAYSTLLMNKVQEPEDRDKLKAICDYVMLIDNEISHIINTEQMLSTDALWRRKLTIPRDLLLEVMEMMDVKARTQNILFHPDIRLEGGERLLSNATGFKLIVSNIISNAIKYSEEGRPVNFSAYCQDGFLVLETEDFGVGMTESQLGRLFQKYEKTNDQKGGQGIGLFMVKQLVEHHHGHIEVRSRVGEGTKMTVRLPMKETAAAETATF